MTAKEKAEKWDGPAFQAPADFSIPSPEAAPAIAPSSPAPAAAAPAPAAPAAPAAEEEEFMGNEPYIDTIRCTSCDDCLKVSS